MACWARDVRAGCMPVSEGAVAGLAKALKAKRKRLGSLKIEILITNTIIDERS